MPSDRQAEIQARVNRATPGRWRFMVVQKPRRGENYPPEVLQTTQVAATYIGHQVRTDHSGGVSPVFDGEFIAHAREDIPWLLAELSRVQIEHEVTALKLAAAEQSHEAAGQKVIEMAARLSRVQQERDEAAEDSEHWKRERLMWTLRNIRMVAARGRGFGHQATPQTAEKMAAKKDAALDHVLRLCAEVGVVGSILRGAGDTPTPGGEQP